MTAICSARRLRATVGIGCMLSTLGWASTALAQAENERPGEAEYDRTSVDLLPLLDVSRGRSNRSPNVLGEEHRSPVGGYVRFWVERTYDDGPLSDRLYSAERRTWLQRFFIGRSRTRLLTARLLVNRAQVVTQTVTLAAASHDSSRRQGENWSTELGDRRFLTPYFRVDPGTTASIEISLSASATVDSDITRNLLAIVERGARLVAPTAPLVTTLTSPRLTETANFVDTSISRLFGQALAERSQSDFAAETWHDGTDAPLAMVSALFPMGSHLWTGTDSRDVGTWHIRVSEPTVSIFSSTLLHGPISEGETTNGPCGPVSNEKSGGQDTLAGHDFQACRAFISLAPSRVLGLPVGENVTLGQVLRGDAGITAALQRFANASSKPQAAGEACELVAERAQVLGLNDYDAAAAVWAFASSGGFSPEVSQLIWGGNCPAAQLAQRLRLSLNTISADQPHPQTDAPETQESTSSSADPNTGGPSGN